jgi:hypothetical protein
VTDTSIVNHARGWVCLAVFLLAVAIIGGCDGGAREASESAAASSGNPETAWRVIGAWSGRGNSQTDSFTVETGALRLRWETRDGQAPGRGLFRATLHSAISGRPLQTIVEQTGAGADTAFFQDDPRVSYLVIDSHDVDWKVTLEEAVKVTPRPAS